MLVISLEFMGSPKKQTDSLNFTNMLISTNIKQTDSLICSYLQTLGDSAGSESVKIGG